MDLATGGNQTLRVALVEDGAEGEVLILSHGFGSGDAFHRPGFCGTPLRLPASVLAELQTALEILGGAR